MEETNKVKKKSFDSLAFTQSLCNPEYEHCHAELVSASNKQTPAVLLVSEPKGVPPQQQRLKRAASCRVQGDRACAFTLAEVLITLAIIGVVAALTIPSVVKNYQKTQTITKLKKAYSTISQAFNNSQAENGMYQTWDKGFDIGATEYFNRYWKPYLKVAKICTSYSVCGYKASAPWKFANGNPNGTNVVALSARTAFLTTDGILFVIFIESNDLADDRIYIDLNGSKEPNQLGKDFFYFIRTDKGIMPYCHSSTASNINSNCSKTGNGTCCAAKLAREGWEMKDDYPW